MGREFVRVSRPFCEAQLPMCSARSDPHLGDLLHFGCMPIPLGKVAVNTERFDLIHMYAYVFWVLQAVNTNTNPQKIVLFAVRSRYSKFGTSAGAR